MKQALSEHSLDGTPKKKGLGRQALYVDAAVSPKEDITGIAIAHEALLRDMTSVWIAKGYCILKRLDPVNAEAWAIWQALNATLEQMPTDSEYVKPRHPCSAVVIYSDRLAVLRRIRKERSRPDAIGVEQMIICQSRELKCLGVEVQLHWVPGHRSIPGNVLANLVATEARQPAKWEIARPLQLPQRAPVSII